MMIAKDLELNMPRRLDILFEVELSHTERSFRLALRGFDRMR